MGGSGGLTLQSGSDGTNINTNISYSLVTNLAAPNGKISLSSDGYPVINDTGYYQVSCGVSVNAGQTGIFRLNILDSASNVFSPGTFYQVQGRGVSNSYIHNVTVILYLASGVGTLTTPPYTLKLTNITGSAINLTTSLNNGTPIASLAIFKLL